jgi:hypothetical protein
MMVGVRRAFKTSIAMNSMGPVRCRAPLGPLSSSFARSRSISIPLGSLLRIRNDDVVLGDVTMKDISILIERSKRPNDITTCFQKLLDRVEFMN